MQTNVSRRCHAIEVELKRNWKTGSEKQLCTLGPSGQSRKAVRLISLSLSLSLHAEKTLIYALSTCSVHLRLCLSVMHELEYRPSHGSPRWGKLLPACPDTSFPAGPPLSDVSTIRVCAYIALAFSVRVRFPNTWSAATPSPDLYFDKRAIAWSRNT